jgi:hypothetical protein
MIRVRTNVARYARRFGQIPDNLRQTLSDAIKEVALVDIETEAKLKLTRDGHIDTGRLRASIHTEYKGSSRILRGRIPNDLTFIVGTNVIYAKKIENIDSYLIWAYKRAIPKLRVKLRQAIREGLEG